MLGYLSKFVLQMLPTISATVIGAYIVATWINPKTPPEPAKMAARLAAKAQGPQTVPAQQTAKASPPADAPVQDVAAALSGTTSTAPAEAKPAQPAVEAVKPVKAATGPDNIRIIPIVRQQTPAAEVSVAAPASLVETPAAIDERKDAAELARAALQRLRGGTEAVRASDEAARPAAPAARVQQARALPEPMQTTLAVTTAPPLPPAVTISSPRYPQAEGQDQARDPATVDAPDRLTPPGEIPVVRAPLNLQATRRVADNPTVADDFVSATKSFFRAITPH